MLEEKIRFAEHLSLMIKGGVPLGEALEILAAESQSKIFKKALGGVSKKILSGESLANSLESYPKVFDKFFYNVVSAGEKGGTLDKNLKYLSSQLRQEFEVKNKIKGALIYPCLVIVMASGIAFFVSFFILPKITGLFKTLAIELPLATKILITSTSFLRQYWILTLAAIIFIILLFRIILKFNFSRFYFDKIILSLPFLSRLFKNMNLARFSRALGTLLKSGVPIVEALEICAKVLPNEVYKKNIISVKFQIERGGKINQGLKNFPGIFIKSLYLTTPIMCNFM